MFKHKCDWEQHKRNKKLLKFRKPKLNKSIIKYDLNGEIIMQVGVAEWLEKVSKLKNAKLKAEAIKANDTTAIRMILQAAFDPKVEWLLPPGTPPYKPNDLHDQEHILIRESRKIPYFIKGFGDHLSPHKREMMFVEMLEMVDPKDAELLCAIKDKKLPFEGITKQIVEEGLPGLIP